MRILAIDPGTTESGYVILDCETKAIVAHGIVDNWGMEHMLLDFDRVTHAVIERIACRGIVAGDSVFLTCEWVGRFHWWLRSRGIPVAFMKRREVLTELLGSHKVRWKGADSKVRAIAIESIGPQGSADKPGSTFGLRYDEWQAAGLALAWMKSIGIGPL